MKADIVKNSLQSCLLDIMIDKVIGGVKEKSTSKISRRTKMLLIVGGFVIGVATVILTGLVVVNLIRKSDWYKRSHNYTVNRSDIHYDAEDIYKRSHNYYTVNRSDIHYDAEDTKREIARCNGLQACYGKPAVNSYKECIAADRKRYGNSEIMATVGIPDDTENIYVIYRFTKQNLDYVMEIYKQRNIKCTDVDLQVELTVNSCGKIPRSDGSRQSVRKDMAVVNLAQGSDTIIFPLVTPNSDPNNDPNFKTIMETLRSLSIDRIDSTGKKTTFSYNNVSNITTSRETFGHSNGSFASKIRVLEYN